MKIAAVKLLQRKPNGSIIEIISVPKFEIPEDFVQVLFNMHLAESNGKPNFKKIEGETTILSFFSGNKDVFMVEPYYDLVIIPEESGEEKEYLRVSRILLNNILVHVEDASLESYIQKVLRNINSEGTASLKIEKREIKPIPLTPEPSVTPQTVQTVQTVQESNKFSEINELVQEIKTESESEDLSRAASGAADPFGGASGAADPFGGASGAADPFGGASGAADPFGGASGAADPFGGASGAADPFGGASGKASPIRNSSKDSSGSHDTAPVFPVEFKSIDPKELFKSGEEDIAFSENPWEEGDLAKKDKKPDKEPDPFSENPFA